MAAKDEAGIQEEIKQLKASLFVPIQEYLQGLAQLLTLEAKEALSSLKAIILLSLCLLPLMFLAWVSASGLISYLVYEVTLSITWAILTFGIIQIGAIVLAKQLIKKLSHRLSFPYSRKELTNLLNGGIKDESLSRNSTTTAKTPKPTSDTPA